mmetsp:Transcript_10371/g.34393  ORF Transcript_10371/g.34393 Transcript_10371/m.34393 type:complete len:239 (-) Transcript_10371:774-1490(-)
MRADCHPGPPGTALSPTMQTAGSSQKRTFDDGGSRSAGCNAPLPVGESLKATPVRRGSRHRRAASDAWLNPWHELQHARAPAAAASAAAEATGAGAGASVASTASAGPAASGNARGMEGCSGQVEAEAAESVTAMQVGGAGADAKIEASLRAVDVTEIEGGGTFCSAPACGAVPEVRGGHCAAALPTPSLPQETTPQGRCQQTGQTRCSREAHLHTHTHTHTHAALSPTRAHCAVHCQ